MDENSPQHPIAKDGRLRVELVPMPSGDNPWRTRADYLNEQRRDTWRFWLTIVSLLVAIGGVVATSAVAIHTIRSSALIASERAADPV